MSAPVDVLAVLDAEIAVLREEGGAGVAVYALVEARSAVSELIEAARAAEYHLTREHRAPMTIDAADYLTEVQRDRDALRAALARCGGSK